MIRANLLITGSSGRIGSILVSGLDDSFEVYGVDLVATTTGRTFRADISDYRQIAKVLRKLQPLSYVVHLAADPRADADWNSVLKNNVVGTRNLYEAAREYAVKKIVFASSNHVTGGYEGIPPRLTEMPELKILSIHDQVRPDGDYASSKIFGEALARQYYELYGIQSICLRIGTVLGNNNPTNNERNRRTWLSHRDLLQLFAKSILSDVEFGIYYGVSNNKGRFWDISNAREELGYSPQDDASLL